jgi:hypothetical protein
MSLSAGETGGRSNPHLPSTPALIDALLEARLATAHRPRTARLTGS